MGVEGLDFEKSVELKETGADVFTNVHRPWTWPGSTVIPGGLLMSEAAAAAYRTVDGKQFALDNLQTQFLAGASADKPINYKVTKLSQGRRFAVRAVTAEQEGRICVHVVIGFLNRKDAKPKGPIFEHCVSRVVGGKLIAGGLPKDISPEMDDLAVGRNEYGSWMKFQRLPLIPNTKDRIPEQTVVPCICKMFPIKVSPRQDPIPHVLGLLNLSDYHVMDTHLQRHGITFGLPHIGQPNNSKRTTNHQILYTSLNHSVHIHIQPEGDSEGKGSWRADEMMYVEVTSPWAKDGRAYLQSRMYTKDGTLAATCVQESYYVMKDGAKSDLSSKI